MLPYFSRESKLSLLNVYEGDACMSLDAVTNSILYSTKKALKKTVLEVYTICIILPSDVVLYNAVHCMFTLALHFMFKTGSRYGS